MKEESQPKGTMTAIEKCGTTIPEDLLIEILIWLPVVSLLRFKSVSKSWFSLISSSHFVSRHLRLTNSKNNPDNRLVVVNTRRWLDNGDFSTTANFISLNDPQHSNYAELVPSMDGDPKGRGGQLVACFNGIICLIYKKYVDEAHRDWVDVVSLWNPATKQLRTLPLPHHKIQHTNLSYGFGFDPQTSDYKLVRILQPNFPNHKFIPSRAEVYSLRGDSWRIIDAVLPLHVDIVSNPRKPFPDDNYCWVASGGSYSIISFNFGSETFGNILLPEDLTEAPNTLHLAFLREKIACISSQFTSHGSFDFTIWVLDDNWVKMYTFCPDNVLFTMIAFSTDGKIILKKRTTTSSNDGVVCVYDPCSKEMKEIPTQGGSVCQIAQYKESLVAVKRQDGI